MTCFLVVCLLVISRCGAEPRDAIEASDAAKSVADVPMVQGAPSISENLSKSVQISGDGPIRPQCDLVIALVDASIAVVSSSTGKICWHRSVISNAESLSEYHATDPSVVVIPAANGTLFRIIDGGRKLHVRSAASPLIEAET
jgi:hypothetical protein